MEPTNFPFGLSRETTIRRTADGKWSHDGDPIDNDKLARAFDRWMERAEDGRWCLKNDINWAYFTLEGAPYFVRWAKLDGEKATLRLSNDREVQLDFRTLREGPDGVLYCTALGEAARFESHAAVALGELLEEDEGGPYFTIGGERIRPPRREDPLT
ncbi:MAG TPA: hypothetical protein VFX59_04070 [Polyangiales bacterium]|nr:hypothetical protein [Polyangiales bacterium]